MKLTNMIRYNIFKDKKSLFWFIGLYLGLALLPVISVFIQTGSFHMKSDFISGYNIFGFGVIALFILGCSTAGQKMDYAMANGVSRKTMFFSMSVTALIFTAVAAVFMAVVNIGFNNLSGANYLYGGYMNSFKTETVYYVIDDENDKQVAQISEEEYNEYFFDKSKLAEKYGANTYLDGDYVLNTEYKSINKNFFLDIAFDFISMTEAFFAGWLIGALIKLTSRRFKIITLVVVLSLNIISGIAAGYYQAVVENGGSNVVIEKILDFLLWCIKKAYLIENWITEKFSHTAICGFAVIAVLFAADFITNHYIKPKKTQS